MSAVRLPIPRPPVLGLILIGAMIATRVALPGSLLLPWPAALAVGVPLAVAGLALAVIAERQLLRAGTTVETFGVPATTFRGGAFSRSRNPIYLGLVVFLAGVAVGLNQPYGLLAPVAFLAACNFGYIPYEEARMRAAFGEEYEGYRRAVRRWI